MLAPTTKIDLPSFAHVFAGIILISGRFCEYTLSDDATYIAMLPVQVLLIVSPVWVFCANDAVNCNRMSEWRTI